MHATKLLRLVLSIAASISALIALIFLVAAIYASATIPVGQVNESMVGYISAVVFGLLGAALFVAANALNRHAEH